MVEQATKRIFLLFTCLVFVGTFCSAFNGAINKSSRQLHFPLPGKRLSLGYIVGRRVNPMLIYSAPNDDTTGSRHSYVEGGTYSDIYAEIEAMGGDPFFIDDEESQVKMSERKPGTAQGITPEKLDFGASLEKADKSLATNGMGPTPVKKNISYKTDSDWEWDGIVDEEAHLGLD